MLKKCFDGFADEEGAIPAENVGNILSMMGLKVKPTALRSIIEEIDEDGNSRIVNLNELLTKIANFLLIIGYIPYCFFGCMLIPKGNKLGFSSYSNEQMN